MSHEANIYKIIDAFNAGMTNVAIQYCEEALKFEPENPILNHLLAVSHFAMNNFGAAFASAEVSLLSGPTNREARLVAARSARALGQFHLAETHFRRLDSNDPVRNLEIARTIDSVGKRGEATTLWNEIWRNDPSQREAAARLGRLAWEDGRFKEAQSYLEIAVEGACPASTWFDLALARQDLGDLPGAASAFREALTRKPDDAQAAFNLGVVLQGAGEIEAAVAAYSSAYMISKSTLGMIANSLSSGRTGMVFESRAVLERFLSL